MTLYELIVVDPTDSVYDPIWRQGTYVLPFITKLGVVSSIFGWSLGINTASSSLWNYETVFFTHITLAGLLTLASFWHWYY